MSRESRHGVLNTRPRTQAAELSRLLQQAGFEPIGAPAIEVLPAWDPAELEATLQDLAGGALAWVVLPSQNAGLRLEQALRHTRVVCGTQTARVLGLTPTLGLDRFSAASALEALRPLVQPGQRILVPRAAGGRDELTVGLEALGAVVRAPIAYRTAAVEPSTLVDIAAQLRSHAIHAVTVCSPSAVRSLLAGVGRECLAMSPLLCLGETTAQAARAAGLSVDGVAEKTTMPSLVAAVRTALVVLA